MVISQPMIARNFLFLAMRLIGINPHSKGWTMLYG